eukprot:g12720.t1
MAEAIDDEVFRTSARVGHCFDFFRAGWSSLPVSLGLGPGVGLPDNVVTLRDRDAFHLYGMPLSQSNTPAVAVLVREKMELLGRMLGPAVLLVGTDSGDAEVENFAQGERNFAPPDKMATLVMRRGRDQPAANTTAMRLRHKFATFLGEAGGLGVALNILDEAIADLDSVDNSPVLANLKSNRAEDLWRGLRIVIRRIASARPDVVFAFHWVPGHAGISPHSEADILQKHHLPDLPLRDFCPQLSVPLRLVRVHIRENLRETVAKEVSTRGDSSSTGCMRGTFAARFGSLRRWLKGLSNVQKEIVFSLMSGDGRAAARLMGAKVGADCLRCGICDGRASSCVIWRDSHDSQPIDSRVAFSHDDTPFEAIPAAAEAAAQGPAPMPGGILREEADQDSVGELTSDSEVPSAVAGDGGAAEVANQVGGEGRAAAGELLADQENFVEDLDPVTGLPVAEGVFGLDPVADDEGPVPMEIDDEGVNHTEWAEADGLAAWENRRLAERGSPVEPDAM